MTDVTPGEIIVGRTYRFTYRLDGQRKDRQCVLRAIGFDGTNYVLDARPVAGTQLLPKDAISRIEAMPARSVIRP